MELGLTLGDASKSFGFMEKPRNHHQIVTKNTSKKELGLFCMGLSIGSGREDDDDEEDVHQKIDDDHDEDDDVDVDNRSRKSREKLNNEPPMQLDLLPLTPVPRNPHHQQQQPSIQAFPWPSSDNGSSGRAASSGPIVLHTRGFDVNRLPTVVTTTTTEDVEEGAALSSSPSGASSFQMEFSMYRSAGNGNGSGNGNGNGNGSGSGGSKRDYEAVDVEEDDENGSSTRKKLRLSKEQSAFLEESFKEHNTLNPKQKLALAKQLNLRPRQVEVWFQNRRARTKLKQTEVDCEYLKRCCETLTDENRRLHKELQELRALKSTSNNPFYRQLPATTLTMCPSCERVATTTSTTNTTSNTDKTSKTATATATATATPTASFSLSRPRFYPFTHTTHQTNQPKAS